MLKNSYGRFLAIGLAAAMAVTSVLPIGISADAASTKEADNASGTSLSYTSDTNPIGTFNTDGKPLYGGDPSILVDGDTVYLYVGQRFTIFLSIAVTQLKTLTIGNIMELFSI